MTAAIPRTGRDPLSGSQRQESIVPGMMGVVTESKAVLGLLNAEFQQAAAKIHLASQRIAQEADSIPRLAYTGIMGQSIRAGVSDPNAASAVASVAAAAAPAKKSSPFRQMLATVAQNAAGDEVAHDYENAEQRLVGRHRNRGGVSDPTAAPRVEDTTPARRSVPTRRAPAGLRPPQSRPEPEPERSPERQPAPRQRFMDEFHRGQSSVGGQHGSLTTSLSQIGKVAGSRIDASLSRRIADSSPPQFSVADDGSGGKHWVDSDGQHVADMGANGEAVGARAGEVTSSLATTSRMGRIGNALVARGGGSLAAGLAGTAARFAGPVAAIATVAYQGIKFAEAQREENRAYQQISGGTNTSGIFDSSGENSTRVGEKLFSLSQMGTMGGDQAAELYKGVAKLGLKGGTRDQALDFSTSEFRKTGLDVSTSMSLISTAVKSGNTNFVSLAAGLSKVGEAAKNAGTNVQEASDKFAETFKNVTANVTQGGAAAAIASNVNAPLRTIGESLSGVTADGTVDPNADYAGASLLGMDPTEVQNTISAGGTGATKLSAKMADARLQQAMTQSIPAEVQAKIRSQIKAEAAKSPDHKVGPGLVKEITVKAMTEGRVDLNRVVDAFSEAGYGGVSLATVQQLAGASLSDNTKNLPGGALSQQFQQDKQENPDNITDTRKIGDNSILSGGSTDRETQSDIIGPGLVDQGQKDLSQQNIDLLDKMGFHPIKDERTGATKTDFGMRSGSEDVYKTYLGSVHNTGQRSQAVEKLLGANSADYSNSQFIVQTKDGPKQVGLQELVATYGDQAAAGNVMIQSGEGAGQKISDITQITQGDGSFSAGQDPSKGAKDVHAAEGSVVISLQGDAAKYFQTSSSGSAINLSNQNGSPTPSNPPAYQLPSAQGTTGGVNRRGQ